MRIIDHFPPRSTPTARHGDVFDPNTGQVQAHVVLGDAAVLEAAVAAAQAAQHVS